VPPVLLTKEGVSPLWAAGATDLGGSSKYSSSTLEVWSGGGFLDNCNSSRVSRSLALGVNLVMLHS